MSSFRNRNDRARVRRLRPGLEGLEDRVTPTTFHVTNLVTLQAAIATANEHSGSNTIILLPRGTIPLSGQELSIKANVSIEGKGAGKSIIDGDNSSRVIQVLGRDRVDHGRDDRGRPRRGRRGRDP